MIARYMYEEFQKKGIPVTLVRSVDETVSPTERVNRILDAYGDNPNVVIISNHINAAGSGIQGAEGAEVIYALRDNSNLASNILTSLGNAGQKMRKFYQRRLPSDTSKDYYFIHRNTGSKTQPIIIEYGFINNPTDLARIQNNYKTYVDNIVDAVIATAEGETKQLVLPDGSKVWLNENTSLEYPENFEDDIRLLSLNGEAYFEVTSNKHKPFVVKGSTMQIEVLGTKFNFKNSDKCRIAEASLLEGEIKASGNANEGLITLSPGQKVELNAYTRQMKVSNTDAEIDAIWHNDFVQLKNANIYDIALMLERIYNVNIVLSPEINKGNTYSGVLQKKKNIDEVLDILSHTIHFNYVINKRNIFISVE